MKGVAGQALGLLVFSRGPSSCLGVLFALVEYGVGKEEGEIKGSGRRREAGGGDREGGEREEEAEGQEERHRDREETERLS